MALKQTQGWRWIWGKPYMNGAERQHLAELVEAGVITVFNVGACKRCGRDVIKGKTFCSKECYEQQEETDGQANGKVDR